jgi:hypothetical protein
MKTDHASTEAAERAKYQGYTEAEIDQALAQSLRSDWPSILLRLAIVVTTYGLLARAILAEPLPAALIALPLIVELLAIFWLGLFLATFVVDDQAFRTSARKPWATLFWTALAMAGLFMWLTLSPTSGRSQLENVAPNLAEARRMIVDSGLHWALIAVTGGLVVTTLFEVLDWKRRGGVFVWTSITTAGFRLGLGIVALAPLVVLGIFVAPLIESWFTRSPADARAWLTWGVLLLLEIAVVVVGVLMHRDILGKGGPKTARAAARGQLPG